MFTKNIYVKFLLFLTIFFLITSCSSETSNNDQNAELEAKLRIANAELTAVAIVNEAKIKSNTENNQSVVPTPDVSKIEQVFPTPQINRIPKSTETNNNNKSTEKNLLLSPTNIPKNILNNNSSPIPTVTTLIPTVTNNSAMSLIWNPTPTAKPSLNRIPVIPTPTPTTIPDKYGEISLLPPLNVDRSQHTAVRMADGKVMVLGGTTNSKTTKSVEIFDPRNGRWEEKADLNFPRYEARAVALKDNRVLVVNGINCNIQECYDGPLYFDKAGTSYAINDNQSYNKFIWPEDEKKAEIYDPIKDQWTIVKMNRNHGGRADLILLDDGQVLVIGSNSKKLPNPDGSEYYLTTHIPEVFDPSLDEFYEISAHKYAAQNDSFALKLKDNRVLVLHYDYKFNENENDRPQIHEIFDPSTGLWNDIEFSCFIGGSNGSKGIKMFSNGELFISSSYEKKLPHSPEDICYGAIKLNVDNRTITKLSPTSNNSGEFSIMLNNDRKLNLSGEGISEYNPLNIDDNMYFLTFNPMKGSIPIQLMDGRVVLTGGLGSNTIVYHPKVID